MIQELLVDIITALVKVVKVSREAAAADLEAVAAGIRSGKLVPDEAFEKAKETRDATKAVRDSLPD